MIKVICFDLGKVIINFDYAQSLQELAKITPLPITEVMRVLADDSLVLDYETGKISTADFYRLLSETLKLSASLEKFKQLWGSMFLPEPLLSESFLQALKKTYRLILLSNTNEIHFEFVREKYAILSHIEEHVLSYQVGWMKPHSQIYRAAIERAGVPAEQIFFTDDRQENVEAARMAGMQAVQFHSEDQLKREMRLLGISF